MSRTGLHNTSGAGSASGTGSPAERGLRAAIAGRAAAIVDRWLGPLRDDTATDRDCLAAQMLWWDPCVLPRTAR